MGQELVIPQAFKLAKPAQAFQKLIGTESLSEGIGQGYPVIGYKGKVWSLRVRGQRYNILRPDDGTPSSYLDVIILGTAKAKSKSYYKDFKDGDNSPPLCSSIDGLVPDADVPMKQADNCALCPMNQWKTDPKTGRKGRECTDYKRLAVLILPPQTKPILGQALVEPVFLRVPPDSLTSLAIMGDTMEAEGFFYSAYVTRITFDPMKAHPCMVFTPLQPLTDAEEPLISELRRDPTVGRITGGDLALAGPKTVTAPVPTGSAATGLAALAAGTPTPPAASQPPVSPLALPPPASTGLSEAALHGLSGAVAQPATQLQNTSAGANPLGLVDTGFGGVSSVSIQPPPSAAVQTVADAGEPEEADLDLDARIAKLIKR